ncbi:basement membrane-specific heparan sulfate proteoglycan core protein [Teleopsis dalmanni]|uniref:basement membrane-specific heparan sulfate proteoglycan core protein n=1 Tax=Teleopsis dalmanni TaxID=139649 RepID=UPI0018CFA80B|nr:basement membrane-specific heparan sulfate proteoglycan core protein [Teleopsis dalmanni]
MGSRAPLGKPTNSIRNITLLWKILTVIVIIQACGVYNSYAKELKSDVTFDDTFDIDQSDESPALNQKYRGIRELDEQALRDDELQPVEDALAESNENWLVKGVKRVRRELNRIFGSKDDENKPRKHRKRNEERRTKKEQNHEVQVQHKKHPREHKGETQPRRKHLGAKQNNHKKRASMGDDYVEGSGAFIEENDGEDEIERKEYYRTLFTIHEPWQEVLRDGPRSQEFNTLHRQIETGFRDLYQRNYTTDDDDDSIRATLLGVVPTEDKFKIHVVVQLEIPSRVHNFGDILRNYIVENLRLGDLGAEIDDQYYFRHIQDVLDPIDFGVEPTYTQPEEETVSGTYGGDVYEPHVDNSNVDNTNYDNTNYDHTNRDNGDDNTNYDHSNRDDNTNYDNNTGDNTNYDNNNGDNTNYDNNNGDNNNYDNNNGDNNNGDNNNYDNNNGDNTNYDNNNYDNNNGDDTNYDNTNDNNRDDDNGNEVNKNIDENYDPNRDNIYGREDENNVPRERTNCDLQPNGYFTCNNGQYIECRKRCNNYFDCDDESDEDEAMCGDPIETDEQTNYPEENDHQEPPTSKPDYIPHIDIDDGSGDDLDQFRPTTETDPLYSRPTEDGCRGDASFTCPYSGKQICDEHRCDGREDCPDGEDEHNCPGSEEAGIGGTEDNAGSPNVCTENEFMCDNHCLPNAYKCNGAYECVDRTDEENCRECQPNEYRCQSGDCIDARRRCDKYRDCPDGDDEDESCPTECSKVEFQCKSGYHCLSESQVCDGYLDCPDGDDEDHCDGIVPRIKFFCPKGKFTCRDLSCISIIHRCDGRVDCPSDRSDEEGCPCLYEKWQCDDGTCISKEFRCNGNIDCPEDISDERHCENGGADWCQFNEFQCDNGQCIPMREVCDNIYDCTDYSDEKDCDIRDFERNRFDDNEIIREYAPHHRRPTTSRPSILHELDSKEFTEYRPNIYYKSKGHSCTEREFKCGNNVCIPLHLRCDGFYHCNDLTDELNCEAYTKTTEGPPLPIVRTTTARPIQRTTTITTTISRYAYKNEVYLKLNILGNSCLENIEFACQNGDCIPVESVCDGISDCERHEDEDNLLCTCSSDKFKCLRGGGCIPRVQVCDGRAQCSDGSDESSCHFHAKYNKTRASVECLSLQYQCADGICISGYKRCNGITDCSDGSDELNCPLNYDDTNYDFDQEPTLNECDIYEFECDYSQCIPIEKKCDGYPDCDDETDELDCPPFTEHCHENEFECDQNYCILRDQQCNGIKDCNDATDERNCTYCRDGAYLCNNGECISHKLRCNGLNDCNDASDELNCDCPNLTIKCNGTCVDWNLHCDGKEDCADGSDERDCDDHDHIDINIFNKTCREDQWQCDNSECINKDFLCDNNPDCKDNSDESRHQCSKQDAILQTPEDCSSDQFFCDAECRPISIRCNGYPDCLDRSDEQNCTLYPFPTRRPPTYPCPQHTCPNGKCYSQSERCDGSRDCDDGSDEMNCCASNQFRCRNGDCVPESAHCNGYPECRDSSDEEECSEPNYGNCSPSQFRCDNGECVNAATRCNGYTDCRDSSDEKYCKYLRYPYFKFKGYNRGCGFNMFRCENGPCIQANLRCNGIVDCPLDISDELDCGPVTNEIDNESPQSSNPQLNLKTYPDSQIIKESREVIFRCRDEGPLRAKVKWTRPGGRPLPPGFTDKNGRLEIPNIRMEDSGKYICEAVGYPRHVAGQQVSVHLTVERYNPLLDRPPSACRVNQATCMNNECIEKSQICDGIPHCSDGSDEHSCSHGRKCQPNQFMCRNSKCIERIWRCDGENDCGDNSDEDSCDPEPSGAPCRYDEFQCRSGHCIPKSFQCDDTNDCVDGSDEIGCMVPVPIRPPPPRINLQVGNPLNLTCVATGVPVPTIIWRLNWGHVPEKCASRSHAGTGTLYCPNMEVGDSGAYSCEIINSKGSTFVTPDTLVTVEEPDRPDVCPSGFFNMLARRREDCISCFCFGVSSTCHSANLFNFAIQPPIISHRVVNVELNPYSNIVINEAPAPTIINLHHGVQFRASDVPYGARDAPYLALPADYMGNQLKSYGGSLKYEVNFIGSGRPTQSPDVIITGNGFTLVHRARTQPQASSTNKVSAQFTYGNWQKPDGARATREEIMMILANVDNILIRLGYIDSTEREVELTNIIMDSAGLQDRGLGPASLVEQCSCPKGYIGDSCETCAPGFVRQPGGPWLGRCVPFVPEPCGAGTYGDPRRGIPCRECPCPLTGSNNFASGCQLGPDGEVSCYCNEGYTGRRCEVCAEGYQGNPLVPGGRCYRIPEVNCNAVGTYYPHQNGTCECKPLVVGPRCDTCAPDSFHLNSFTFTGCIECFCSGLTKQCSSSSWYRDQIVSNFGVSRAPHGFVLVRDYETSHPSPVSFELSNSALQFNQQASSEPLYWSLPPQFLGDKISAYGGKLAYNLSYNPLPGGLMSRNNAPDVVIKSGEDLTIIHYRKSGVNPSQPNSYSVPIIESAWQRSDGQVVNREHLLMALSKIESIFIKATYTTGTKDGSLTHVALDIAVPNNIGTQRAVEVEECQCPGGYVGLSCERCAPGYKRDSEAGLYLGVCEKCECNGHSDQCDAETGVCLNCEHNTDGEFCDRCAPGYVGNALGGSPYDCSRDDGSEPYPPPPPPGNKTVCEYCDRAGSVSCDNGYCICKPNVVGQRCDQCRQGTYGLSENNRDGCEECYCSGKTTDCRSATLYRQLIPVDFFVNEPLITDERGDIIDRNNLNHDAETNTYTYDFTSYTQKYWSLRGSILGNQLYSYGGELSYNLQVESYGNYVRGNDVILIGNGLQLVWSRSEEEEDSADYHIRLHEDEQWHSFKNGEARLSSRLDFMSVLSDLEHILIRATPKIPTTRSSIRDVILETAVERPMAGARVASEVEVCSCPYGYTGISCENCAPLYYRDNYGSCVACSCQEDSSIGCSLDESGYVKCDCKSGFSGDRCQNWDKSYVKSSNCNLSKGFCCNGFQLHLEPNETISYNETVNLYRGNKKIGNITHLHFGCQPETTTTPRTTPDYDYLTEITVSIAPPEITIIPIGGSITLTCTGNLAWNGSPVVVSWYKLRGQMPFSHEEDRGILRLYNLQVYDSGIYICQAVNNKTQKVFEDQVSITITESSQRTPARIVELPSQVTFEEYQPNEINCEVTGNPTPSVSWTRVDGQMSRDAHTDGTRLIFDAPRTSDSGHYRCQANNDIGTDERYTVVNVEESPLQPQPPIREFIYIEPPSWSGEPGQTIRLTCQPTTPITLVYQWNKDGYPIYRQQNVVLSGNQLEIREASPRDSGVYTCIGIDQRGHRNYTSEARVAVEQREPYQPPGPQPGTAVPTIRRMKEENNVIQGQDFTITCEATGTPYPNIKWTKVHEPMADNVHQTGNVLRIINARSENRGMYLCIAENSVGTDQANTIIDVEPRERPTVDIHPDEQQSVYVGAQGLLYCQANGIPEPTVIWRRVDGKPLSPRHKENSPGYIIIEDIQIADAGDYECLAENLAGKTTGISTIRVIEAPVIMIEPSDNLLTVTEGDEVKVVCSASGFPNPSIQWVSADTPEFNLRTAAEHYNQAYLEIYRASKLDAKTYKCIATNEAGTDERYITIDVKPRRGDAPDDSDVDRSPYEPARPDYTSPENVYHAKSGDSVTLTCSLGNMPNMQTRWERLDGRPLPSNSYLDRNSLIITRIEDQNSGKYRCNGFDNRGTIVAFVVAELVLVPLPHITFHPKVPLTVNPNDNVNIYCQVTGEQPIDVAWHTDNNRPLPPSVRIEGQYLNFISITPADAGRYYCSASNRYGNTTNMAEVVVNRGPYEEQPQVRSHYVNEGNDVTLTCEATPEYDPSRGEVRYEWRREDGRQLPSSSIRNQVLFLRNVRLEDEGRYICESYSTAGHISQPSYVDLFVKPGLQPVRPPYIPPIPIATTTTTRAPPVRDYSLKLDQQHSNLRVGESTEVECYSADNAYTDVIWERADEKPMPPHIQQIGNRLIFSHVTPADEGSYVCKCRVDDGDLYTTSFSLEIEDEESEHDWKKPKIQHANIGSMVTLKCEADQSNGRPNYRWSRQYGKMQSDRSIFSEELQLDDVQSNDAGTYVCTATSPNGEVADYPTILVVTGTIPQFHQDPISYMAFPTLPDSYIKFNFDISFRPQEPNGLILFNGQKRGSGDYIALSLKDRYPEFHFDFDGKPIVILAEQPISLNEWHTIRINRFRRDGYMQVDDQRPVAFPTLAQVSPLDLIEDLYIGGVPNFDLLPQDAVDNKVGFVGCISRLSLQGKVVDLMKEAKFKEGITACQPCSDRPCENGGICLESQTEMAHTCICQQGWTGTNCAVEGTQCTPGVCGAGRCENTEMGMECLCPLNKTGDRCQYIEHLNENSLAFKTNSYAAYGTPRASKLNVRFKVRPNSLDDAVLFYAAESKLPAGDFIAVVLRNEHIELIINTGARPKPVVVRSLNPLPVNKWTEIEISRRYGESILRVGEDPEQKAKSSGLARTLFIKTPMYIGGYDHENVKLNRDVNITNGLNGCISNLYEAQRQINLIADIQDAVNIQNCGEINEIDNNEISHNIEDPSQPETEDLVPQDACSSDPCENGGTCSIRNNNAECSCILGFSGKHCEEHIMIEFDANFHGNGYLELNRSEFSKAIEQKYSFAGMVFSTTSPNGLLLWWGQELGQEYTGQDFMALAVVDGIVEFSIRMNGEETVIRNPEKRVDDGRRHIALIKRTDNTAILELDHLLDAGETRPTGKETMTLPGNVFIGGTPDVAMFTGGRYHNNFNGCVRVVEGESSGIIQLNQAAISGVNVDACPVADDSLEGTEPPVV